MAKRERKADVDEAAVASTASVGAGEVEQNGGLALLESEEGKEAQEAELVRLRAELAEREAELAEIRRVVADAVDGVEAETYRLTGKQSVAGEGFRYVRGTASGTITRAQYVALPVLVRGFFEAEE